MTEYRKGQKIGISLSELYKYSSDISCGYIDHDDDDGEDGYYDLYNRDGEVVCMDGETCIIKDVLDYGLVLINDDGLTPKEFTLNYAEIGVAVFN